MLKTSELGTETHIRSPSDLEGWGGKVGSPLTYLYSLSLLPHQPLCSQPPGKTLTGHSVGPSSALPGGPYNSVDFSEISPSTSSDSGEGISVRVPSGVPTVSQDLGDFFLRTTLLPDHGTLGFPVRARLVGRVDSFT